MKKIFVVTDGSYSGYRIIAVFSERDKAQLLIDKSIDYDDPVIEEYELDKPIEEWFCTRVTMDEEGNVTGILHYMNLGGGTKTPWFIRERNGKFTLVLDVATDDETRAIKVTNEKRAQILANNLWGKNNILGEGEKLCV